MADSSYDNDEYNKGRQMMKKLLPLIALGCLAHSALAANDITTLQGVSQAQFNDLSEDLGSALSYKPVTPAASLGVTGFDMGIEVTQTNMAKSAQLWSTITGGGGTVNDLYIPKLHIAKGLPFGFDIAGFYSKIPTTNISLYGAELRYAIIDGGVTTPAVAIRGAYTKLNGVSVLALDTKSLDLSISKGFAMLTPYAGVGKVWTNSTPIPGFGLVEDSFSQNKLFAGANLNLGFTNLAMEWDKTGAARSLSLKLGFRF
jgi:hypothetical protein